MSRAAPRVHADQAVIDRMEAIATRLEQDSRVALRTDRGELLQGMVSATPTVQAFFDAEGCEGLNGVVKIEDEQDGREHYLWLDEVASVERLPNPAPPEPSDGHRPRDPNAPAARL